MNIISASDYLNLLLRRLAAIDEAALLISNEECDAIPNDIWATVEQLQIIQKTQPAGAVICDGCEEQCVRSVIIYSASYKSPARAFIECDVREDIGRVNIGFERLNQWQVSEQQLAQTIAKLCGITQTLTNQNNIWTLGVYTAKKHRAVLSIDFKKKVLLVNEVSLPLIEILFFTESKLNIDTKKIIQTIDLGLAPAGKTQNRAIRKSKTQTRNKTWNKEYKRLQKGNPNLSDAEIAKRIAKMPIADGKDSETIRKNMK